MSNFKKFSEWMNVREDMREQPQQKVAVDPKVAALNAQKAAAAAKKYQIDFQKLAKDPKALQQAQNKIIADPQLGPEVAANMFKSL
jgi:hypothetical protein